MEKQHLFFFDVETTGLPKGRNLSYLEYNKWPRIVSICWLITDYNGNIIEEFYELIKPNGFIIPKDVEKIHGISTEKAKRDGISYAEMIKALEGSINTHSLSYLVAHNIEFDRNVLFSELVRNNNSILNALSALPTACTMKSSTNYCKLPHKNRRYNGYKWPKLSELHWKLFQRGILLEHDAKEDILATKDCFFKLKEIGVLRIPLLDSSPVEITKVKTNSKRQNKKISLSFDDQTWKMIDVLHLEPDEWEDFALITKKYNKNVAEMKNLFGSSGGKMMQEIAGRKLDDMRVAYEYFEEKFLELETGSPTKTKSQNRKKITQKTENEIQINGYSDHKKRSFTLLLISLVHWLIAINFGIGLFYFLALVTSFYWYRSGD